MSEKGYEILGLALVLFAGVGIYAAAKEAKDAYYKHKLLKHSKALESIGERLCNLLTETTEQVEENEELEVQ